MTAGEWGGRLIDGRFELLQRLGGGGMGLVWRARDALLHREVALKEVRAPDASMYGDDPSVAHVLRERVLREAQALARLHHPNVVTIYHIVDSTDLAHPWLVMELVTGGSLHDRLDQGPLSYAEAVTVGRGVLSALRAAHAAGIQHRDVKPANVLLRPDGTPVLTDFGIAALQESPGLTATGMMIGSPEYMAPERIRGQEGDPASDLWSLGLMLYVGLEGFNPLRRETTVATIAAVVDGEIPAPTRSGPLTTVLSALLVRDPARRIGAEQLDQMLGDVERSLQHGARPDMPPAWPTTVELAAPRTDETPIVNPYTGLTEQTRRKPRVVPYVLSGIAAVAMSGGMVWIIHKAATTAAGNTSSNSPSFSISHPLGGTGGVSGAPDDSASGPSTPAPATGAAIQDLHTPAGVRGMLGTVAKVTGGTKVTSMTIYPTYASIEAVKASDHTLYDNFYYRDGKASWESAGGHLGTKATIDPMSVKWDVLPSLMQAADTQLNVANPKSRYVILDYDTMDKQWQLSVYVSDDYGSGFLTAKTDGTILRKHPQGS